MRVILTFLTFGILVILIPPMIGMMVPEQDAAEVALLEGGDPSIILSPPAAGGREKAIGCPLDRVQFARSVEGYVYILDKRSNMALAQSQDGVRLFSVSEVGRFKPLSVMPDDNQAVELGTILEQCIGSDILAKDTGIHLDMQADSVR